MGSTSSTHTSIMNKYHFTGNNNGITSGSQSVGTAHASSTTDVSPKTDLNYSQSINPSWWGNVRNVLRHTGQAISGTVGNNSDLIQTFKHVGATALRVALADGDFKTKTVNLVEGLLNSSTPEGSLTSKEQVPFKMISDIATIQAEAVDKLPKVQDAYHTLALGSSGMRNNEVSTQPTEESIIALYNRASPVEKQDENMIIQAAGPKLGIIPREVTTPPSDIAICTFDNKLSTYGRLAMVKKQAQDITHDQNRILFSILHSDASLLGTAGILKPFTMETSQFIGMINQVTLPFTAQSYPNGHLFGSTDLIKSKKTILDIVTGKEFDTVALSSYAYKLPTTEDERDIRIRLSGQIVIVNQVYDPLQPIELGFLYVRKSDQRLCFNKCVLINVDEKSSTPSLIRKTRSISDKYSDSYNVDDKLNVYTDVEQMWVNGKRDEYDQILRLVEDGKDDAEILTHIRHRRDTTQTSGVSASNVFANDPSNTNITREVGTKFSYSSQWQVALNMTSTSEVNIVEALGEVDPEWVKNKRTFNLILVARYPPGLSMSVAVQTPTLHVTAIKTPTKMRYIGTSYYGNVIDLLGSIPDWYSTDDMHDPWKLYYMVISPMINYAGRIAQVHVRDGASYQLTVDHVKNCRSISGLDPLTEDQMKEHVTALIVGVGRWMSDDGPLKGYKREQRKQLFMRIVEKVMFQSLTHIDVYADKVSMLSTAYLIDCNKMNAIEIRMDKAISGAK